MPIAKNVPPKASLKVLQTGLAQLIVLKQSRKRWMRIHPGTVRPKHILYPHPLYGVRLLDLLAGQSFGATLHKVSWMYFIGRPETPLACAETSAVAGKHRKFRLTEGAFVKNVFRAIHTLRTDPRLRHGSFELRSVRIESLHGFALWMKSGRRYEYWIPVTPIGQTFTHGRWFTRNEFAELLRKEAKRVSALHARASQLIEKARLDFSS